jgi:hypothetical protein
MKSKTIRQLIKASAEQEEIILSFGETVADITQAIFPQYEERFLKMLPEENNSTADRTALIVEWAIEFQNIHEKTEWDGEYLETLWEFVKGKFSA